VQKVDSMREVVARLEQTVRDVEARFIAVDEVVSPQTGGQANRPPFSLPGGPALTSWLQDVSQQLKDQVWAAIEDKMEDFVARAVEQAARDLSVSLGTVVKPQTGDPSKDAAGDYEAQRNAAAARIQARARMRHEKVEFQRRKVAITRLQAFARGWQARRGGGAATLNWAIRQQRKRHGDWLDAFDEACKNRGQTADGIGRQGLLLALLKVHGSRVSGAQAEALWAGVTDGMRKAGIDAVTFCQICEAIATGDREASEFADLPAEKYAALNLVAAGPAELNDRGRAAVKIQARIRGRQARSVWSKQKEVVGKLQRSARLWLARKQGGAKLFAAAAAKVAARHKDWTDIFHEHGEGAVELGVTPFCSALCQVHPRLNLTQARVLFAGFCDGMGAVGVNLYGFCSIAEAVAIGDRAAAEFADLSAEDFAALHSTEAEGSAPEEEVPVPVSEEPEVVKRHLSRKELQQEGVYQLEESAAIPKSGGG